MQTLIIFTHPKTKKSICSKILKGVLQSLNQKQADYEVLDLYKMNYDPVMKDLELYTSGNKEVSEENLQIQQKIKESANLIFIYPVWWGGMPAILKGFVDRVFTPNFAFKYRRDKFLNFIPDKLLADKKIAVFISFGGPKFLYSLILNPVKTTARFVVFGIFAKKIKIFDIYKANSFEAEKREKEIEKLTKKAISWILD